METKTLLREEFENEVKELSKLKVGSDDYKLAVDGVTKLADRIIEIEKNEQDLIEKEVSREIDLDFKSKELKMEKIDRVVKNSITIGSTLLMAGISVWGALGTWQFEEKGTIASFMGRSFLNRLLPRK